MSLHLICPCSILGESYIELQLYLGLLGLLQVRVNTFIHDAHRPLSNTFLIQRRFTVSNQNPWSQMHFGIYKFLEFRKVKYCMYYLGWDFIVKHISIATEDYSL